MKNELSVFCGRELKEGEIMYRFGMILVVVILFLGGCDKRSLDKMVGVVTDVEYIVGIAFLKVDVAKMVVRFADGRVKIFEGIYRGVICRGQVNEILYNRRGIRSVICREKL